MSKRPISSVRFLFVFYSEEGVPVSINMEKTSLYVLIRVKMVSLY